MKTQVVEVDINPHIRYIWVSRLPSRLPRGYCGGRRVRQYRHTPARAIRMFDACSNAGMQWSQDNNGTHFKQAA